MSTPYSRPRPSKRMQFQVSLVGPMWTNMRKAGMLITLEDVSPASNGRCLQKQLQFSLRLQQLAMRRPHWRC